MSKFDFLKSWWKAVPLLLLLSIIAIYKFRYTLNLVKPEVEVVEAIDSSYLLNKNKQEIIARGTIMEIPFHGIDATRYPIDHPMDSGMDLITNDRFYIIKLYDPSTKIEIYIAIRDLALLDKLPFSYSFETGEKILVTAFIRNKSGVNAMYGGTIHNNRGKLKLVSYNRVTNTATGELDAELDGVIENALCEVKGLKFNNAILQYNKINN